MAQFARMALCLLLAAALCLPLRAQFFLNGDAVQLNDTCFQLTEDDFFSSGSIWEAAKIDLRQSFNLIIEVNLGCRDADGADGIVLGIQPLSTSIGQGGEGIGFQGVRPSLGIEMDTWQNDNLADPAFDHMAIIRDGNLNHSAANTLAGPIAISAAGPNVEDCRFHQMRVVWDAQAQLLETYFDCELRLSYAGDLVNDIFDGDPEVFWGVTSATGGATNVHQVCFTYTTFLDQLEDVTMCPEGQVQLEARGGSTYRWSPATGLSDPTVPDPVAAPEQTTDYVVAIQDACGREFTDSVTVFVDGNALPLDLGRDTALCEGETLMLDVTAPSTQYAWADGSTEGSRRIDAAGTYAVTATRTDIYCIVTDRITVDYIPTPAIRFSSPDTTLCPGQTLVLRPSFVGGLPAWPDGSIRDTFELDRDATVSATVRNACGSASATIRVQYDPCDELYIPSAFSPNGDGSNDVFRLYDGGDVVMVERFQVFTRWGELVYSVGAQPSGDGGPAWDGRFRGSPLPAGTYVYQVQVLFRDGSSQLRSGEVVLMR